MDSLEFLARARAMLVAAEHVRQMRDLPGAAGLAFQASDLAMKALTLAIDGSDAGTHQDRMRRTRAILTDQAGEIDFLWQVRQRDFYGDVRAGDEAGAPSDAQIARAVDLARGLIEHVDAAINDAAERHDSSQ